MARLFDSHAHYYDARFYEGGNTPDALLHTLFAGEVGTILNIGTSLENAGAVLSQAAKYPRMFAAIGIHPTDGQGYADPAAALAALEVLLADPARRADPACRTIEKTRYCVREGGFVWEIDVFPFWSDKAFLDVELPREDTPVTPPAFVRVIREVTDDNRYTNHALAIELPE